MNKGVFSLFLFLSVPLFAMERIRPAQDLLKKFVKFHAYTGSSGTPKPNINQYYQANRRFVAKMDSFGLDRYFCLTNNQHVDALVEAVQQGHGMGLDWYYYEEEETQEGFASEIRELARETGFSGNITEVAPKIVVVSNDQD